MDKPPSPPGTVVRESEILDDLEQVENERDRLRTDKAELVAALTAVLRHCVTADGMPDKGKGRTDEQQAAYAAARAVLAKTMGEIAIRVNVNFSQSAYETLENLARRKGTTMSEVLRRAIELEKFVQDEQEKGNRLLIESTGEVREVLVR